MSVTSVKDFILAIDPGNEESAFCFIEKATYRPVYFEKINNYDAKSKILDWIQINASKESGEIFRVSEAAIEMVASYGMAVGKTVFDTCVWVGIFTEMLNQIGIPVSYIYRKDEKMNICGQMKAKDANIRAALIDRFAQFDLKNGKGSKSNPDWFFGFKADIWAAYAVGITALDIINGRYRSYK